MRDERARLSELNRQISADLKKMLKPASDHLDDAEGWLAPQVLRHPPRSDNEMARWLHFVGGILDRAIKHRKWVEAAIKKFSTGKKFTSVPAEAADKLLPPGPYLTGRDAHAAMIALEAAAETIHAALCLIRERVKTAAAGDAVNGEK